MEEADGSSHRRWLPGKHAGVLHADPHCLVPAIRAEPLMGMRLQDRGARPYHFSAFAARVARCRHLSQSTMRFWQRRKVRKSTLASRLSGSIHIHHHVLLLATIPQSTWAGKGRCSLKEL